MDSVRTSDGKIVTLDETLRDASPVLKEHSAKDPTFLKLSVPSNTLTLLLEAHRNGSFPEDLSEAWSLLAAACEQELQELVLRCAESVLGLKTFIEVEYPTEWSPETVMHCFKVLLRGPMRTADIYKQQIARIAKHCNSGESVNNAINLIKQKLSQYKKINLEGIPFNFDRRSIPIVILEREGKLRTAVIDGGHLKPVDLLGRHFNIGTLKVRDNFYIKYGCYVLFKSGSCVYRKDLQDDREPIKLLDRCVRFLTRENFVFAVCDGRRYDTVYQWALDEKFVIVFSSCFHIYSLDFEPKERLLVINTDFFRLEVLELRKKGYQVVHEAYAQKLWGVAVWGNRVSYVSQEEDSNLPRGELDPEWSLTTCELLDEQGRCGSRRNKTSKSRIKLPDMIGIKSRGGLCLVLKAGSIQIVDDFNSLNVVATISTNGEQFAISELSLLH